MSLNKYKYLIALSHFSKFGPIRLKRILRKFSSFEDAFNASLSDLTEAGIETSVAQEFISYRPGIDIESILNIMNKENITVIDIKNDSYPEILKEIYNPPQILYLKGSLMKNDDSIAVVGSRNYTNYGKQIIDDVVRKIAKTNISIVSGLALGVDAHAHSVTLEEGGRTVAVLGSGLDTGSIYPSYNRHLSQKIVENGGCLVSEFPIGTAPLKHHFPQRNRIISGLSLMTLVIEAREKSGALITARDALEQNREVMAVPGSIYSSLSAGPNKLIKDGAKVVTRFEDVLESLDLHNVNNYIKTSAYKAENSEEEKILKLLEDETVHIDTLVKLSGLDIKTVNTTLSMMEIKGAVKNLGGMNYVIKK